MCLLLVGMPNPSKTEDVTIPPMPINNTANKMLKIMQLFFVSVSLSHVATFSSDLLGKVFEFFSGVSYNKNYIILIIDEIFKAVYHTILS